LRRLRRERVDMLLLHEPAPEDISDELIRWLERQHAEGRAGCIGIGARRSQLDPIVSAIRGPWQCLQTNWAMGDPALADYDRFASTHGALRVIDEVRAALARDPAARARASAATGTDLEAPDALAGALLGAAIANNPKGLVLVATSRPERIAMLAEPHAPLRLWKEMA
jgi:hypothetical protein